MRQSRRLRPDPMRNRTVIVEAPDRSVDRGRAEAAYEALVALAGASGRSEARDEFIRHATRPGGCEYRFQGMLGFGGKYHDPGYGVPYASCYPEDETPARKAAVAAVNTRFGAIFGDVA